MLFRSDMRFDVKAQAATRVNASLYVPIIEILTFRFESGFHFVSHSDFSGAYYYRGYSGWHFASGLDLGFPLVEEDSATLLDLGVGFLGGGSFSTYYHNSQMFFYPGLRLEPFTSLGLQGTRPFIFLLSIPLDFYFRSDLVFSGHFGLKLSAIIDFGRL